MPEFRVRYEQVVVYEMTVTADNEGEALRKAAAEIDEHEAVGIEVDSTRPIITVVINEQGVVSKPLVTTFPRK